VPALEIAEHRCVEGEDGVEFGVDQCQFLVQVPVADGEAFEHGRGAGEWLGGRSGGPGLFQRGHQSGTGHGPVSGADRFRCGHQDRLDLGHHGDPGAHCGGALGAQYPQRFHGSVPGFRGGAGVAGQYRFGGLIGVERVGFSLQPAGLPVRAHHLDDVNALADEYA